MIVADTWWLGAAWTLREKEYWLGNSSRSDFTMSCFGKYVSGKIDGELVCFWAWNVPRVGVGEKRVSKVFELPATPSEIYRRREILSRGEYTGKSTRGRSHRLTQQQVSRVPFGNFRIESLVSKISVGNDLTFPWASRPIVPPWYRLEILLFRSRYCNFSRGRGDAEYCIITGFGMSNGYIFRWFEILMFQIFRLSKSSYLRTSNPRIFTFSS